MISFLNPGLLWLFSLLLPVFALYFLKSKPVRHNVPSNLIWRAVLERIKPNSFLQRFQNSLFLFLQILVISLVVLALARPTGLFGRGAKRIVILDVSASMQANDLLPSRFLAAVERAKRLGTGNPGRTALYTLGSALQPLVRFTENSGEFLNALSRLKPEHTATPNEEKFLRMLRDLEGLSADEIYLLTDTLEPSIPGDFMPQTAIHVEIFGKSEANVGIVGCEANLNPQSGEVLANLIVQNENPSQVEISLRIDGRDLPEYPFHVLLGPHQRALVNLPTFPSGKSLIILTAPNEKNISNADDRWYICDPELKPAVFIAAPADSILFRLKHALPLIDFAAFRPGSPASGATAFLIKGEIPEEAKKLPACIFMPEGGKVKPGEILPWESDHPLTRYANWDAAPIECFSPSNLAGTPLVEAVEGVLLSEEVLSNAHSRFSHLRLGIDPDHSAMSGNLFLPIMLYNCLEYLLRDKFPKLSYQIGHPTLQALWKGKGPLEAGFLEVPGRPGTFVGVNMQAPSEVVLKPGKSQSPTLIQKNARSLKEQETSPWQALLSVAFLFLMGEWFAFMRRN